jgi:hypothetical protein
MHQAIEPKGCSHGAGFLFQFQSLPTAFRSLVFYPLLISITSAHFTFLQLATGVADVESVNAFSSPNLKRTQH